MPVAGGQRQVRGTRLCQIRPNNLQIEVAGEMSNLKRVQVAAKFLLTDTFSRELLRHMCVGVHCKQANEPLISDVKVMQMELVHVLCTPAATLTLILTTSEFL